MLIYVVEGATGEYSDHQEWLVKAFKSEAKAKEFVVKCTKEAHKIEAKAAYFQFDRREDETHSFDPKYRRDYTGVHYTYFSVELE